MSVKILNVRGLDKQSPRFREELVRMAHRLGLDPSAIAGVMSIESGFGPAAVNPHTRATGLIQFMPSTAKMLGTSVEELATMSALDQLVFVERYFSPLASRIKSEADHYIAVFMPAHIGEPLSRVLFRRGEKGYEQNTGLDQNKDGEITIGDVTKTLLSRLDDARGKPRLTVEVGEIADPKELVPGSELPRSVSLPTLRFGDEGNAVRALCRLIGVAVVDKFSMSLDSQVRTFQKTRGLDADGVIGPKSWAEILK